jgi:hypothetical protein
MSEIEKVEVSLLDEFSAGTWDVGDLIYIKDSVTGLDKKFLVKSVERVFDENGEKVVVELNSVEGDLTAFLISLEVDVKAWALYTKQPEVRWQIFRD